MSGQSHLLGTQFVDKYGKARHGWHEAVVQLRDEVSWRTFR
jgi:hypothetical protein